VQKTFTTEVEFQHVGSTANLAIEAASVKNQCFEGGCAADI
jgi:hypothetical protein